MGAGTITLAEIVGSPAESHRQEAIMGDHARGLRGGPAKQCTLQATCVAHGLKAMVTGTIWEEGFPVNREHALNDGTWCGIERL